jgi:polygalacturonase
MLNRILPLAMVGTAALYPTLTSAAHSILDYGALATELECDTPTAFANTEAFRQALKAANTSLTDRVVHIPKLPTNQSIYMMPILMENLNNVSFVIDGNVIASSDHINWPNHTDWHMAKTEEYMHSHQRLRGSDYGPCLSFWEIHDSDGVYFSGSGTVDGQGYWWWMRDYLVLNYANRPHLLRMERVRNSRIEGIRWINSPMYHLFLIDIHNFYIADFEIFVDVYEQKKLA